MVATSASLESVAPPARSLPSAADFEPTADLGASPPRATHSCSAQSCHSRRDILPFERLTTRCDKEISILTLNTLAKQWGTIKRGQYSTHVRYSWVSRIKLLHQWIEESDADIVCLQEVSSKEVASDWLEFAQKNGYSFAFQTKSLSIRLAILFRKSRFRLVWGKSLQRTFFLALKLLNEPESAPLVWVSNVHLSGHPTRVPHRFRQMKDLINELLKAQARLERHVPLRERRIVVAGDYNSGRSHGPYRFLLDGVLSDEFREPEYPRVSCFGPAWRGDEEGKRTAALAAQGEIPTASHPFSFHDTFSHEEPRQATFMNNHVESVIDFIVCSGALHTSATRALLEHEERDHLRKNGGLPTRSFPSDHLPVCAVLHVS